VDAAQSLGMLLELGGCAVRLAHDGPGALAAAEASPPDLILLDIGLPGMDGYEVARRLRARPDTRDAVLVAVTGYGREEDRARSRQAGFDHHLVKPLEFAALQQVFDAVRPLASVGTGANGKGKAGAAGAE
jgi:CheY-like chemotaxis protein